MNVRATTEASPDRVWEVLGDVEHWPRWTPTFESVTPRTPGIRPGLGVAYNVRQPKLPAATWTITTWTPGVEFTWVARSAGVRTTGTHRIEPTDTGGSTVTLAAEWTGPLAPIVRLLYGRLSQRYVETELRSLLARVEA